MSREYTQEKLNRIAEKIKDIRKVIEESEQEAKVENIERDVHLHATLTNLIQTYDKLQADLAKDYADELAAIDSDGDRYADDLYEYLQSLEEDVKKDATVHTYRFESAEKEESPAEESFVLEEAKQALEETGSYLSESDTYTHLESKLKELQLEEKGKKALRRLGSFLQQLGEEDSSK